MNDKTTEERDLAVDLAVAAYRIAALALIISMCDADPKFRDYVINRLTEGEES